MEPEVSSGISEAARRRKYWARAGWGDSVWAGTADCWSSGWRGERRYWALSSVTEAGNIFILTFTANHYWKLGKPGLVNCLKFVAGTLNIAVGLRTKKALIIDTESGAVRKRFSESEEIREVEVGGQVVYNLHPRQPSPLSLQSGNSADNSQVIITSRLCDELYYLKSMKNILDIID